MNTLAEQYCQLHQIRRDDFARHLLLRSLYPRARWVHSLLELIPNYFAPDLELINAIGRLESPAGFAAEVAEFHYHPDNLGRLRRDWRLRLSVMRLQQIMEATFAGRLATVESLPPFATEAEEMPETQDAHGWNALALIRHWRHRHHHPHA